MVRLVSRARIAGIIALASLVIPSVVRVFGHSTLVYWTLFYLFSNGQFFQFFTANFASLGGVLNLFVFFLVLSGGIVLLASSRRPRVGAVLVAVGFFLSLIVLLVVSWSVPISFAFILAGAAIGFTAKPVVPTAAQVLPAMTSTGRLMKLKELLDSGALTKDEFEEEKKKILGEM